MIQSISYTSPGTSVAITMTDGTIWQTDASLPPDTEIRRKLAEWLAAGNTITPYVAPPAPVPQTITPLQARRALRAAGILDAVNTFISTQSDIVQESWEYCVEVNRTDQMIAGAQGALNMTDEQIDDLFRLAVTL